MGLHATRVRVGSRFTVNAVSRWASLSITCLALACGSSDSTPETAVGPSITPARPAPPAPSPSPSQPVLPNGVYAVDGLDTELPVGDLDRAFASFGNPDVIAFGETVHTSEGYAQARGRMLRYLVEHRGVRAIGFEAPWRDVDVARAYVERGVGTLNDAIVGLSFRAWMSRGTVTFIEWLRTYNQAHPSDMAAVFGFDVQDPSSSAAYVRAVFAKALPSENALVHTLDICIGARFDKLYDAFNDPVDGAILKLEANETSDRYAACIQATENVRTFMNANEASIVAASSSEEFELARFGVRSLAANEGEYFYFNQPRESYEARDLGMADGVDVMRAVHAPGKRVALVAHNDHIMRARDELVINAGDYEWKSMGSWLGERLGDAYAPVGLFARRVEYNWDGSGVAELPLRDGPNDIERPLHDLGVPYLFVNLADNAVYDPSKSYAITEAETGKPARHFRGIFFLEHSPPFQAP